MYEKSKEEFVKLHDIATQAAETKKATMKYIHETYKDGKESTAKLNEMNDLYYQTMEAAQNNVIEAIRTDSENARNSLKNIASADVPDKFASDLAVINARGDSLSEYDIKMFLEKYAESYPAYCAIAATLAKTYHFINRHVQIMKAEEIEEEINTMENDLVQIAKNYVPSLSNSLKIFSDNGIITIINDHVEKFVNGQWAEYV